MMPLRTLGTVLVALAALAAASLAGAQSVDTMVTPMDGPPTTGTSDPPLPAPSTAPAPGPLVGDMPRDAVHAGAPTREQADAFAGAVDLAPLEDLAVHYRGRTKSFHSFSSAMMQFITGPRSVDDQSDPFTLLDLVFRPERYEDRALVYVKKKNVRDEIIRALERSGQQQLERARAQGFEITPEQEQEAMRGFHRDMYAFFETGLIAPSYLENDPVVAERMEVLRRDLIRTAKPVQAIESALTLRRPERLRGLLRLVPPPGGGVDDPWFTLDELVERGTSDPVLARMPGDLRDRLAAAWTGLGASWGRSDAEGVNAALATLGELLPAVNDDPEVYPDRGRLHWESWYFENGNMTIVWLPYAFSLVPLLLFVVFRWRGALWTGMTLFSIAALLHTFSVGLRWYVAGRWPNSNMFEAVTTAAWMGAAFAVPWELWMRKRSIRGLVAIGAAATCVVALMAAHFYPAYLDPHISNRMPVLVDLWLYIHTNVIIFSYALIFMAAITAGLYVAWRFVHWLRGLDGTREYARAGGAAALIQKGPDGTPLLERPKTTVGQVLDGTTMILMEFSFVLLWAGIVMGAIWADHSWGRPWGWDPKEVFALNTFLVFAVLIHVRKTTKDKGLWTALIAMVGAAVMIFNWVIINFTIAGLHSYA